MNKIQIEIIALQHSVTQTHSFAVVLGELGGLRRLPIVIGGFEAQAIAVALDNMKPQRPLTHDLFKDLCDKFGIHLDHVFIHKLLDGVFYAQLVCRNSETEFAIDSRTSDALALAVRFECPIYIDESILNEAGVVADPTEDVVPADVEDQIAELTGTDSETDFSKLSNEELEEHLQQALRNEDYELAARIRDELKKK